MPFILKNILPAEEKTVRDGTFIVILHALRIPPHLLVCSDGLAYSISVNGRHAAEPLENYIQLINRKKIPALFAEWKLPEEISPFRFRKILEKKILEYECVNEKISCLYPIRDSAAEVYGNEMNAAGFIFELLPLLEKQNALGKTYAFNMAEYPDNGNTFKLLTYNSGQLKKAILAAQNSAASNTPLQ